MKKKKLLCLSSIATLLLTLGACSLEDDDSVQSGDSTDSVETEPDTRDPVADLFESVKENNNYTQLIEYYYIYTTTKFSSLDDLYEYYQYYLDDQDLWVEITYTNDAMLIEYYASMYDYYVSNPVDTELYVNSTEGLKVYQVSDSSQDLECTSTVENYTWQTYFYSLLNLSNYAFYFERGAAVNSSDGEILTYDITGMSNYRFLQMLVYSMFYGGNYFGESVGGPNDVLSLAYYGYTSEITYSSDYYVDYDMWITTLDTGAQVWSDSNYQYYVQYDIMSSSIYNVGSSRIPSAYQEFLS